MERLEDEFVAGTLAPSFLITTTNEPPKKKRKNNKATPKNIKTKKSRPKEKCELYNQFLYQQ